MTHTGVISGDFCDILPGDRFYVVNSRTGEVCETWKYDGKKAPPKDEWIRLYQRMMVEVAESGLLKTVVQHRLLAWLIGRTGFGNKIFFQYNDVMKALGISRSTVYRSLSSLCECGIIEVESDHGKPSCYRLNPNFGWRGDLKWRSPQQVRWAKKGEKKLRETGSD